MEPQRPDPEQLLKQLKQQTKVRGKLKIFFGACAGVGKTFAMLSAAKEKRDEKYEVVVGIIETHGRQETAKLLTGFPQIPLRAVEYHGIIINEFDLDAALEQVPDILLVDELAHTNAVGSRHPKRWQDVQELLERGIDVYTTLNVQHLESLNDIVTQLTGIHVKETVPDSIFDHADEIVLVDIPSEIIIERLNEGKVYLGEFAKQRAASHFFKIENLIALREIALRRTAERVDALRDVYKKYQSKIPILDKILVCISPGFLSTKLVRNAKQLATKLKSPWIALYVENDNHNRLAKEEQNFITKTLNLAEQLGAKAEVLHGSNTAKAILAYAKECNITKIILGKSSHPKWKRWIVGSLVDEIIENSGNIDVYIINEDISQPKIKKKKIAPPWISYFNAIFIIAFCTFLGLPTKAWLEPQTVLMIYLAGVVVVSATSEPGVAIFSAILCVLFYDFFFMSPYYSIRYSYLQELVTMGILLLTALVISSLTSRLRQQNLFARKREKYMSDLYSLSRKLIVTPGKAKIAKVASLHIGDIFDCAATIWLPNDEDYLELVSHPGIKAELKEESVAQWAYKHKQIAGFSTNTMPSARGYYLPLSNGDTVLGVLGIIPKEVDRTFSIEENMLLDSLAIQTALALQRVKIADQTQKPIKEK